MGSRCIGVFGNHDLIPECAPSPLVPAFGYRHQEEVAEGDFHGVVGGSGVSELGNLSVVLSVDESRTDPQAVIISQPTSAPKTPPVSQPLRVSKPPR